VLVVDRDATLAEALARLLAASGQRTAHAAFPEATARAALEQPAVAVVDADGDVELVEELVETLRLRAAGLRVLLLVGDADGQVALRRSGADGLVSRYSAVEDLVQAIWACRAGRAPAAPRPGRRGRGAAVHGPAPQLTEREVLVLRAVVAGQRTREIAARLGISPHTVRTHVQNILGKLGARSRTEAGMIALRQGLVPLPATG